MKQNLKDFLIVLLFLAAFCVAGTIDCNQAQAYELEQSTN
jgi:hypothetical protein